MAIRSKEFIGIAESIRSHEISLKSKIESLEGTLTVLRRSQSSLEQHLSSLSMELHMVSAYRDEDDSMDYDAIAHVEREIGSIQAELAEVNDEISLTDLELSQAQDEYDEVEEEKQQTLFEIEQRAQISAQNISVVSGMYGAYADVGSNLQQTFQSGFDSLVQASRILGGNISTLQGLSQGGVSQSPNSKPQISGSISTGTGTGKASSFISGSNSAFSGRPSSNSFISGQIPISHSCSSMQQSSAKGSSELTVHSSQSPLVVNNTSGSIKQGISTESIFSKQGSIPNHNVEKLLPIKGTNNSEVKGVSELHQVPSTEENETAPSSGYTDFRNCPSSNGHWSNSEQRGNSIWIPDRDYVPKKYNPNNRTWGEILDDYHIEGIQFINGEPDFSPVSLPAVQIDFTFDRATNFKMADIEQAKMWKCERKDVTQWRLDPNHPHTWHEGRNRTTMQLVPRIIHGNIPHRGGISVERKEVQENLIKVFAVVGLISVTLENRSKFDNIATNRQTTTKQQVADNRSETLEQPTFGQETQ